MVRKYFAIRFLGVVAVLAFACSQQAHAQLYAREAPPGSTFVHVFNATPSTGVAVQIGDRALPPLLPYTATAFMFLPPGEHTIQAGAHKQAFALEGNHYYT